MEYTDLAKKKLLSKQQEVDDDYLHFYHSYKAKSREITAYIRTQLRCMLVAP